MICDLWLKARKMFVSFRLFSWPEELTAPVDAFLSVFSLWAFTWGFVYFDNITVQVVAAALPASSVVGVVLPR